MALSAFASHEPLKLFFLPQTDSRIMQLGIPAAELPVVRKAPAATLTDTQLTCDSVSVTYYTNAAYSSPGSYDFYFYFHNMAEQFPLVLMDVYFTTNTGLVAGTYTSANGDISLDNIILAQDYYDYLYAYYGYPNYTFTEAVLVITANSNGSWTFGLTLTDDSGNTYSLTVTQVVDLDVSDYDPNEDDDDDDDDADYSYEPTTVSTVNATMNAAEFDTRYFSDYGDVDIYLYSVDANGDTTAVAPFYVYVDQIDPDIYIPAGTYTINSTYETGSVEASAGLLYSDTYEQYYPSAAYYAVLDADGYIDYLYYLVSGTMTVSKNADNTICVVINAVSGNGSTVNLTYGAGSSAVENVDAASVQKFFRDGQIIIRKADRDYSVLGTAL